MILNAIVINCVSFFLGIKLDFIFELITIIILCKHFIVTNETCFRINKNQALEFFKNHKRIILLFLFLVLTLKNVDK